MGWIPIEEARENLKIWLDAERAVATGQSYKIGTRTLTRASLSDIAERITYWRNVIEKLESGRSGIRTQRAIPKDW